MAGYKKPYKKGYKKYSKAQRVKGRYSKIPRAGNLHKTMPIKLRIQLQSSDQVLARIGFGSLYTARQASFLDTNMNTIPATHHRMVFNPSLYNGDYVYKYSTTGANPNTQMRNINLEPLFMRNFAQMYNTMMIEKVTYNIRVSNMGPTIDGTNIAAINSTLNHTIAIVDASNSFPEVSYASNLGMLGWWWGSSKNSQFAQVLSESPRATTVTTSLDGNSSSLSLSRTIDLYKSFGNDATRKGTQAQSQVTYLRQGTGKTVGELNIESQCATTGSWTYPNLPTQVTDWPSLVVVTTCPFIDQKRQEYELANVGVAVPPYIIGTAFTGQAAVNQIATQYWSCLFDIDVHYDVSFWGQRMPDLEIQTQLGETDA